MYGRTVITIGKSGGGPFADKKYRDLKNILRGTDKPLIGRLRSWLSFCCEKYNKSAPGFDRAHQITSILTYLHAKGLAREFKVNSRKVSSKASYASAGSVSREVSDDDRDSGSESDDIEVLIATFSKLLRKAGSKKK